jgi:hypothetical protein
MLESAHQLATNINNRSGGEEGDDESRYSALKIETEIPHTYWSTSKSIVNLIQHFLENY